MRYSVREARSSVMGSMIRVGSGSSGDVKDKTFFNKTINKTWQTDYFLLFLARRLFNY